jgi:hypothetical protein
LVNNEKSKKAEARIGFAGFRVLGIRFWVDLGVTKGGAG